VKDHLVAIKWFVGKKKTTTWWPKTKSHGGHKWFLGKE